MSACPEEIQSLLRDFAAVLEAEPEALAPRFSDEPLPDDIELVYHPPAAPATGPKSVAASAAPAGLPPQVAYRAFSMMC